MSLPPPRPAPPLIALIDDDAGVRESLSRLLSVHGFAVAPYVDPQEFLDDLETNPPVCVVADLTTPHLSGFELQQELADRGVGYPIVFITGFGDIRSSVEAMRRGAVDFLVKPFAPKDLLAAVERGVAASADVHEERARLQWLHRRLELLTAREREVFELVVAGYLNKQIGAHLGISEKTVKVHRARVMRKMSARSIAQLARVAEQLGIDAKRESR